ncbi:hypothetical protein NT2_05_03000 [Caenibius tardaugens NBRC 16725]|uniref:Uncharacterized protein n=1 Tax=Caenibius tardaugens NBRC 16725 TaxID=1219035 RepID=U2ZVJ5_9SPHN|nr:hypothetical protein NT2_05_03000 [Caenibius tardaugens NBRC 16725]
MTAKEIVPWCIIVSTGPGAVRVELGQGWKTACLKPTGLKRMGLKRMDLKRTGPPPMKGAGRVFNGFGPFPAR